MRDSVPKQLTHLPALVFGLATLVLFVARPNIERYLNKHAPDNHMPDAFNGLNDVIPTFIFFVTTTLMLAGQFLRNRQYRLFLPLFFGPFICVAGWFLTDNFADPNWFHLFALSTIGMLVSSMVSVVLSILDTKATEPSDAPKLPTSG